MRLMTAKLTNQSSAAGCSYVRLPVDSADPAGGYLGKELLLLMGWDCWFQPAQDDVHRCERDAAKELCYKLSLHQNAKLTLGSGTHCLLHGD